MHRPSAHRTGDLGEAIFVEALTRYDWVVDKLTPDYGFDYFAQPVVGREVAPYFALFQVKARSNEDPASTTFRVRLESKHAAYWRAMPAPAFVVAVEVSRRRIFFKSCHDPDVLNADESKTFSVQFDGATLLTDAMEKRMRQGVCDFWETLRVGVGTAVTAMLISLLGVASSFSGIGGAFSGRSISRALLAVKLRRLMGLRRENIPTTAVAFKRWLQECARRRA